MLDYLKKVLALTRLYRLRFGVGLACGFLSGALAFTLPVSLKLAVDTVFSDAATAGKGGPSNDYGAELPAGTPATSAPVVSAPVGGSNQSFKQSLTSRIPAPLKRTLDNLVQWFRPSGEHASKARLLLVIALIPGSMLLRSMLGYLNTYFLAWVGIRAANDLRVKLFKHLLDMPLEFYSSTSTGDLMTRVESAISVNHTIQNAFSVIIREPITVVVLVVTLIAMQPLLSLFTLMVFPIALVPLIIFGRKHRRSNYSGYAESSNLSRVMHEAFTGIRVIKGFNLEDRITTEFRRATDGVTRFFMRSIRAGELPGPLIEFIGSLGVALVFAYFAFAGKAPAGDMLSFFIAVFGLYAPMKNISRLRHQLSNCRDNVNPLYELLNRKTTIPEPANPKPLKAQGAPIRFENVTFAYGQKAVLKNVTLTIQPGQMVALVGRTGSGKTSIANLLLRFYDPQSGTIQIGDTNIRDITSQDLRGNIAVVTQETILFNDTIRHNIGLGRAGATDAEIEEAAKHAYAHEFIKEKAQKYETQVGEKGVNVSGGQRQRIAIARAILKNAPILILDEATSALDTESEQRVQEALEELMKGRTTICIAHRLSTIQNADLIVVLDQGCIVEMGTHEQLLQARGLYCKFYELAFEPASA
jgi:ATP-binding cassette, subfamily B, bacterial MsbA